MQLDLLDPLVLLVVMVLVVHVDRLVLSERMVKKEQSVLQELWGMEFPLSHLRTTATILEIVILTTVGHYGF